MLEGQKDNMQPVRGVMHMLEASFRQLLILKGTPEGESMQ